MIEYKTISIEDTVKFLDDNYSWREDILLSDTTKETYSLAILIDGEIVGISSVIFFVKTARIRALFVKKEFRKKDISKKLIKKTISVLKKNEKITSITAFATHLGVKSFEDNGFEVKYKRKVNNDFYVEVKV